MMDSLLGSVEVVGHRFLVTDGRLNDEVRVTPPDYCLIKLLFDWLLLGALKLFKNFLLPVIQFDCFVIMRVLLATLKGPSSLRGHPLHSSSGPFWEVGGVCLARSDGCRGLSSSRLPNATSFTKSKDTWHFRKIFRCRPHYQIDYSTRNFRSGSLKLKRYSCYSNKK